MKKLLKRPILFSFVVAFVLIGVYVALAAIFQFGVNMSAGTVISLNITLITIIITSIGLSISGYIFLNNYFGTITENDKSLSSIVGDLNKTYIIKIMIASVVSALFILFCFLVIFMMKEQEGVAYAFKGVTAGIIFQHMSYIGSIGSILYNFHFLCHIINPTRLIEKRAEKVVRDQITYLKDKYTNILDGLDYSKKGWKKYKETSQVENTIRYGAPKNGKEPRLSEQSLALVKNIHEMECIIEKVIELNAIKERNNDKEEAMKFVFSDTSIGGVKHEKRMQLISAGCADLKTYSREMEELIEKYVDYYEHLVILRNALIKIERGKVKTIQSSDIILKFVTMMTRITLDRFSNFVKITNLNIGGGYFQEAHFNWSDLSESNMTGSNFKKAQMENAVLKGSDMSNSKLDQAILTDADMREVNLGYASMIGTDCSAVNLSGAKMTDVTFHEKGNIAKNIRLKESLLDCLKNDNVNWKRLRQCSEDVSNFKLVCKAKLNTATLENVMMKSVDMSCLSLYGASFSNSVMTNSMWLHTIEATGLRAQNVNFRKSLAVQCDFSMSDFQFSNLAEMVWVDVNSKQSCFSDTSGFGMKVIGSSEKVLVSTNSGQIYSDFQDALFADKNFQVNMIIDKNVFSNWTQINFCNINAVESRWYNTILNESDFAGAIFKNAVFQNIAANWVNMNECDFTYAKLMHVSLRMSKLVSAIFTRAALECISFEDANLYGSNFVHASISDTDFTQCNLNSANFSHAFIQSCDFMNCELEGIYLQSTTFKNVVFDRNSFLHILKLYQGKKDITFICCEVRGNNTNEIYNTIKNSISTTCNIKVMQEKRLGNTVIIING